VDSSSDVVKLPPLERDEILRGIIFFGSLLLIFFSFSSSNLLYGLCCLFISLFFISLLFWKGPIATDLSYLISRYSDNLAFYLNKGEVYLCESFKAKKKSERVLVGIAYNFSLVMFFVVPIDLLFQELTKGENSLLLYQQFITWIIYVIESSLGIEVFIRGEHSTTLVYRDMIDLEIVSECTGLHETVFLSLLILCFRGVKPMIRLKWAAYSVIFIFIENLVRILSSYPIVHTWEVSTWEKYHYFWWHTGQYALIMSLFVLWIMIVAGHPPNKSPRTEFVR
tara:strand:- start:39 stop:881 length:843 start_codon:yes stop_codon:yes gene_type:complete